MIGKEVVMAEYIGVKPSGDLFAICATNKQQAQAMMGATWVEVINADEEASDAFNDEFVRSQESGKAVRIIVEQ